jgi:hypothetical protein
MFSDLQRQHSIIEIFVTESIVDRRQRFFAAVFVLPQEFLAVVVGLIAFGHLAFVLSTLVAEA